MFSHGKKIEKPFFLLPGKIKGDQYRFDFAVSRYGNQNALSPTNCKRERFKVKNYIFYIKDSYISKIAVYSSKREICICVA